MLTIISKPYLPTKKKNFKKCIYHYYHFHQYSPPSLPDEKNKHLVKGKKKKTLSREDEPFHRKSIAIYCTNIYKEGRL